MANTTEYKKQIEAWFRDTYLPNKHPECSVQSGNVSLIWGGNFQYDALVYKNDSLIAVYCLSCSEYRTAGGKGGSGKLNKIKGDILMMLGTTCPAKVLSFSGKTMMEKIQREQKNGRLPKEIQCEHIQLPEYLSTIVQSVSAESVKEVTPNRASHQKDGSSYCLSL
jgi:hypothetical protein